jgi:hypothetical protein
VGKGSFPDPPFWALTLQRGSAAQVEKGVQCDEEGPRHPSQPPVASLEIPEPVMFLLVNPSVQRIRLYFH